MMYSYSLGRRFLFSFGVAGKSVVQSAAAGRRFGAAVVEQPGFEAAQPPKASGAHPRPSSEGKHLLEQPLFLKMSAFRFPTERGLKAVIDPLP